MTPADRKALTDFVDQLRGLDLRTRRLELLAATAIGYVASHAPALAHLIGA